MLYVLKFYLVRHHILQSEYSFGVVFEYVIGDQMDFICRICLA